MIIFVCLNYDFLNLIIYTFLSHNYDLLSIFHVIIVIYQDIIYEGGNGL